MREFKFVSFQEFKAKTDGPGGWEGYLSQTGEIDDGGDLILQGAYADTIDQFVARGFNAESHIWDFSKMIGFPLSAKEDDTGLYVTSQFHGTPDAQLIRQKVSERIAAGKGVYMSIGYEPSAAPIFVTPDEYGKVIPEYSRKGMAEANLVKALQFPQVRILPKVNLFEGSIVSVPMLRSAEVATVKSALDGLDTGLAYADYLATVVDAIKALAGRTEARIAMRTKEGRVLSSANLTELSSAADELEALMKRIRTLLDSATPKPKEDDNEKTINTPDDIRRMVARDLVRLARYTTGDYLNGQIPAVA